MAMTMLADQGATVKELQAAAGHTTPEMALRYLHIVQSHLKGVWDRVDEQWSDAGGVKAPSE
jgi:hypothetical protein